MPVVPYYCGRPACVWIAAMSGPEEVKVPAPSAAASAVTGTSAGSTRSVAPAPRPNAPMSHCAFTVAAPTAGPWATWASNWFAPHCQPLAANGRYARSAVRIPLPAA